MGSAGLCRLLLAIALNSQPLVENGSKDCIFLMGLGGDQMGQERASGFAKCRANILGLLLLSCLLGVQDKRKEVLVI